MESIESLYECTTIRVYYCSTILLYTILQYITKQYITIVRNGSYYESAITTASGCVRLSSNTMQQLAHECINSYAYLGMNENDVLCEIGALPRLPRLRQNAEIADNIHMRDIFHMKPGEFLTDATLTGFLGILNYNYKNTMDFLNTFFLEKIKRKGKSSLSVCSISASSALRASIMENTFW